MGKCLFFDADGTILDIVKGTPEDTKLALQQLRKNGHKTFICTGRSNAIVPEKQNEAGGVGMKFAIYSRKSKATDKGWIT